MNDLTDSSASTPSTPFYIVCASLSVWKIIYEGKFNPLPQKVEKKLVVHSESLPEDKFYSISVTTDG